MPYQDNCNKQIVDDQDYMVRQVAFKADGYTLEAVDTNQDADIVIELYDLGYLPLARANGIATGVGYQVLWFNRKQDGVTDVYTVFEGDDLRPGFLPMMKKYQESNESLFKFLYSDEMITALINFISSEPLGDYELDEVQQNFVDKHGNELTFFAVQSSSKTSDPLPACTWTEFRPDWI